MTGNVTIRTLSIYYVITVIILLSAYFFPAQDVRLVYLPILLSVLLLAPIYVWQSNYRNKTELQRETLRRDKDTMLFWIFALFALALSVRIPSVLLFNQPYEKAPLIYLVILTILLVEKSDLSAFGFKTEKLGKSHLYGFAFFAILNGLTLLVSYVLIYGFTGQMPVQSFDIMSSLLSMPFMTLCVGISEECLFRGYMQTHLEKLYTPRKAILIQAILFGVWHFVWNLNPFNPFGIAQYVITTLFIGLVFGYFFSKTRNLVPLIFAHGLWDSIPPWIIENESVMHYFGTFPTPDQILVLILPFTVSAIAAVFFIKYFVKEI
jgi:membrane protease YdiL (CAAX protease family)